MLSFYTQTEIYFIGGVGNVILNSKTNNKTFFRTTPKTFFKKTGGTKNETN